MIAIIARHALSMWRHHELVKVSIRLCFARMSCDKGQPGFVAFVCQPDPCMFIDPSIR